MLHRAALVSKNASEELNKAFPKVTKVISYLKNSPLEVRLFTKLCEDMGANYTSLLYYCEVRWLSRAKVIRRLRERKEQIAIFLVENHSEEANMLRDDNFLLNSLIWLKFSENGVLFFINQCKGQKWIC